MIKSNCMLITSQLSYKTIELHVDHNFRYSSSLWRYKNTSSHIQYTFPANGRDQNAQFSNYFGMTTTQTRRFKRVPASTFTDNIWEIVCSFLIRRNGVWAIFLCTPLHNKIDLFSYRVARILWIHFIFIHAQSRLWIAYRCLTAIPSYLLIYLSQSLMVVFYIKWAKIWRHSCSQFCRLQSFILLFSRWRQINFRTYNRYKVYNS